MHQSPFSSFILYLEQASESARALHRVTADHVEQLARLQLDAARSLAEIGFAHARSGLEINDPASLSVHLGRQGTLARAATDALRTNGAAWLDLGEKYNDTLQRSAQQSMRNLQGMFAAADAA